MEQNTQLTTLQSKMALAADKPSDFIRAIRGVKTVEEVDELFAQATAAGKAAWVANAVLTLKVYERFDKKNGGSKAAEKWISERLHYSRASAQRYKQVGAKLIELTDVLKEGEELKLPNTRDEFIEMYLRKEKKELSYYEMGESVANILIDNTDKVFVVFAGVAIYGAEKSKTKVYFATTDKTMPKKVFIEDVEINGVTCQQYTDGKKTLNAFKVNIADILD